jgi:hypothetical protein
VTATRMIAKLEALLVRVRARTAEPRSTHGVASAVAPVVPLAPEAPIEEEDDQPTLPPPPVIDLVAQSGDIVEINATYREREVSVAPPVADSPALPLDSRERLVAAPPALELVVEEVPPEPESAPEMERAPEERVDDEPPVSSRRPVMPEPEQRIEEIAFGAEEPSPPRHSPPPESGRLLAAPVTQLEAAKDVPADTEPQARDLIPEAIVADLSASTKVANVIGEAQRFAPTSFSELLEASLAL